ncbi:MAG: hypothetical protein CSB46_04810 [Micrococcales bacterium]|nr:MAG: hypothetical protein CSB46_04810 [Micrococcales bacterium]
MHSNNPAFARRPEFNQERGGTMAPPAPGQQYGYPQQGGYPGHQPGGYPGQYGQPAAQGYGAEVGWNADTGRDDAVMTLDDVLTKTGLLFGILLATAGATWFLLGGSQLLTVATFGAMFAGLGLGLFIAFRKTISVPLIVAYAAVEGVFVGGISRLFEYAYDGIVGTAVMATLATFAGMLALYRMNIIRVTPKFTKILVMATVGYLIFSLVNLAAVWLFKTQSVYQMGLLGIGISLLGVGLAALNLALDFDFVEKGVANRLPAQYSWLAAHGLIVTLVWLYIEILRLIAILRGDN